MAAKTGTTQNGADAWLAGYTPEYTAIVWMGYPDGNRPMDTVDDIRVQGGSIPAMIWHDFMTEATRDMPVASFPTVSYDIYADPPEPAAPSSPPRRTTRSTRAPTPASPLPPGTSSRRSIPAICCSSIPATS